MAEETVAERVTRIIAKEKRISVDELQPETTFNQLQIDSLDALNLIFALEEEFDVNVPNEEAVKMKSVGDVIGGIEALLAAKG